MTPIRTWRRMDMFPSGQPGARNKEVYWPVVKDGNYVRMRVVMKEVVYHLHKLFHIGTQGVDKRLAKAKVRVTSLADVNQSVTQH